jgi:hypothetical protein
MHVRLALSALLACALLSLALNARADDTPFPPPSDPPADVVTPTTPPPPPPGFDGKKRLPDLDLAKKREDDYFTGLPLANYDPNTGVGLGARAYYYIDGKREDPLFAYTPYQHRMFAQAFFTTGGLQFHWLDYDAPALFGSPWRVRSQMIYERNTNRNYFGVDERAQELRFSGDTRTFSRFDDYEKAQQRLRADGTTNGLYDKMMFERPLWLLSVERSLLGGILRPLFGLGFSHGGVTDYTGKTSDALDASGSKVSAPNATTRLREDCDAHRIKGCAGGWDNTLRLGLALDTRDFEPDPNSGFFADLAADFGTQYLASDFDYARVMLAARGYVSPIPRHADLVLAARGIYEVQSQGVPFFSMDTFPFTEDPRTGMGGVRTIRGYKQDRFVGHVMALTNYEIRWTFANTRLLGQRFAFIAVPFLDMGRAFDSVRATSVMHWKRAEGAGLRIAWNQATIIMVDYGVSEEDSGLYVNFTHIF